MLLLKALGASMSDRSFARWTRSQIMRFNSALSRRFEGRLSKFPFLLFRLVGKDWDDDEISEVITSLLRAVALITEIQLARGGAPPRCVDVVDRACRCRSCPLSCPPLALGFLTLSPPSSDSPSSSTWSATESCRRRTPEGRGDVGRGVRGTGRGT